MFPCKMIWWKNPKYIESTKLTLFYMDGNNGQHMDKLEIGTF